MREEAGIQRSGMGGLLVLMGLRSEVILWLDARLKIESDMLQMLSVRYARQALLAYCNREREEPHL